MNDLHMTDGLPYNLEAEQSLLGAIILDPSVLNWILETITAECFFKEEHGRVFAVMTRLFASGHKIDIVTVLDEVVEERIFETDSQAKQYLTDLMKIVPAVSNADAYARIVREKFYLRTLIRTAGDIIEQSAEGGGDASEILDAAEQKIFEIRQGRDAKGLKRIDEVIISSYDRLQKLSGDDRDKYLGVPTGFTMLDNILTGLNKSDLILVAGRPGMGKTSFALNIAENIALGPLKRKVAIFSLEMSDEQLVTRMLSSQAFISSKSLRTGQLAANDWEGLAAAADVLAKANVFIDDSSGVTVPEMKAKLRRQKDLGLVIIDYLQLMSTGGRRSDNRVQEISEITRSLKIMARELNVPVIVVSQLSRGPEGRQDKRPMLSDLRESGSIEQDADVVMFLYRDAYYNKLSERPGVCECIIAKNRHGETDTVELGWAGQYTRFSNLEQFHDED